MAVICGKQMLSIIFLVLLKEELQDGDKTVELRNKISNNANVIKKNKNCKVCKKK